MNIKSNIDFLVVAGPTASGKTALSIKLAHELNGEIINADSVQVYKHLNIGSAKITKEEMEGIKHHLIDIKEPSQEYTVHDFQKDCNNKIEEIKSRGKLPIIVGGTGLYIKSVVYDYELVKQNEDLKLKNKLSKLTNEQLFEIVKDKAKLYNIEIHVNNRQRLLNYAYKIEQGIELKEEKLKMRNCQVIYIGLKREELYSKINQRVDIMIENGLLDEVKQFPHYYPSQRTIGYKEVHMYFEGEYNYEEMIEKIKQHTRNFAKKQITWFNNQMEVDFITQDEIRKYLDK